VFDFIDSKCVTFKWTLKVVELTKV